LHRDPVRSEVLVEYLAKFRGHPLPLAQAPGSSDQRPVSFAGAEVQLIDRVARRGGKTLYLTQREAELVEMLVACPDHVVTYQTLYSEILGRRFRGETANMRVLLGKLTQTFATIGCHLRDWIDVIPKAGYRYRTAPRASTKTAEPSVRRRAKVPVAAR
jgi:DNA-binding response OmpR family regulator